MNASEPTRTVWVNDKRLADRFATTRQTIWRWTARDGFGFPQPVKLSERLTRWRLSDIEAWETSRAQGSNNATA